MQSRCFEALEPQARAAGGRVVVVMGNHEAGFLDSPAEGSAPREFSQELKERGIDPGLVKLGRDAGGIGAGLRGLPLAARLNDWFLRTPATPMDERLQNCAKPLRQAWPLMGLLQMFSWERKAFWKPGCGLVPGGKKTLINLAKALPGYGGTCRLWVSSIW